MIPILFKYQNFIVNHIKDVNRNQFVVSSVFLCEEYMMSRMIEMMTTVRQQKVMNFLLVSC